MTRVECDECSAWCSEGKCPMAHNHVGCMGCGCEQPWGQKEGEEVYCDCDFGS